MKKTYTKDNLTISWEPDKCIHSTKCWHDLPSVFDPRKRPWVNVDGAELEQIKNQIDLCPSGALSYVLTEDEAASEDAHTQITIFANGPAVVQSDCVITLPDGSTETKTGKVALCRCGHSENKPFCDGQHRKVGFEG